MTDRWEIREKMVSPKGKGAFPDYEDISYEVYCNDKILNAKSTREAAEQVMERRKEERRKKKRSRLFRTEGVKDEGSS